MTAGRIKPLAVSAIKDLIMDCDFVLPPWYYRRASRDDIVVEFDTDHQGVDAHGEYECLYFRLAENWHEFVYRDQWHTLIQAMDDHCFILGGEKIAARGMDQAWRFLVAKQRVRRNKMGVVYAYHVCFAGRAVWAWTFAEAKRKLLEPYKDALDGEDADEREGDDE
jgi:hypothetical protein